MIAATRLSRTLSTKGGFHVATKRAVENAPLVTMFLRKDHYLFAGDDGARRLKRLHESYKCSHTQKNNVRVHIPFYLPHAICFQDFKLSYGSTIVSGDVFAQSCFALLVDVPTRNLDGDALTVSTVSDSLWPDVPRYSVWQDVPRDPSSYYRCFVDTHLITTSPVTNRRTEMCSFVHGSNGTLVPERTVIDQFFLTNGHGDEKLFAIPFRFDVDVATDRELGIDDEWGMIQGWARRSS